MSVETLTNWLTAFNAKERHHLAEWIYFGKANLNGKMQPGLDTTHLTELFKHCTGSNKFEILFHSMDYHYDWIFAALNLAKDKKTTENIDENRTTLGSELANGIDTLKSIDNKKKFTKFFNPNFTQQDADWLFLIKHDNNHTLLVIECKLENAWESGQLAGKLYRINSLRNIAKELDIKIKLCLLSPSEPSEGIQNAALKEISHYCKEFKLIEPRIDLNDITFYPFHQNETAYQVSRSIMDEKLNSFRKSKNKYNSWAVYRRKR